jgi:hypothetical protein
MHYDFIAIPDADVPQAVDPSFQHVLTTYASETNTTVGLWLAVPDSLLDFKPHEKTNSIRTIKVVFKENLPSSCFSTSSFPLPLRNAARIDFALFLLGTDEAFDSILVLIVQKPTHRVPKCLPKVIGRWIVAIGLGHAQA